MGVLHGNPFLLASGTATEPAVPLQRSVRLRSSQSAYFNRTQTTTTNSVKCTFSGWVKRGTLGVLQVVFGGYTGTDADTQLYFDTTNQLKFTSRITNVNGAAFEWAGESAAVFRDPSAWYHIVVTVDTSTAQATNNAYYTVYVNNVAQTFTTVSGASLVSAATVQNRNTCWNVSGYSATLGRQRTNYFDGYLTEINFVDGQALKPSNFGGYNAGTNVWEVRKYSGTYGTNGFYLPFTNPASIGADGSGNGNNWTPNGIQISNSALTTYDSMLDVPTNTGSNNANFATLNPLASNTTLTPTQGNLYLGNQATNNFSCVATMGVSSGKWYWEVKPDSNYVIVGVTPLSSVPVNTWPGQPGPQALGYYSNNGQKYNNGTGTAYGATWTSADLMGIALDMDAGTLTFYKNGATQGVAFSGLTGMYFPILGGPNAYNSGHINFGQRPFEQSVPSGHKMLNTFNLPEPTIPRGDKYFEQFLYTGNGGGQQIGEIQKPASLFNLDRSLRLRGSNSASLSRTFSTPTNSTKFTWSGWVKRGALNAVRQGLIGRYIDGNNSFRLFFDTNDTLVLNDTQSASTICNLVTSAVFRDPSIWYHIVLAVDTSNGTAANKNIIYVNGIQMTFSSTTNYSSGSLFNIASAANTIALTTDAGPSNRYLDGYLADVYFIDGQALTPTSFGAFDGNNYWTPKAYTGTYGTNGFHLEFEDFSNNTATTIGKDTSGQGNNWTPTGINVTVPANTNASWDSMVDVPTLTSTDVANFPTLNFLIKGTPSGGTATMSEGNLAWGTNTNSASTIATIPIPTSGKWYWEAVVTTQTYNFCMPGIIKDPQALANLNAAVGALSTGYAIYSPSGQKYNNAVNAAYMAAVAQNTVITIAFDADTGSLYFGAGGSWANGAGLTNQTWANAVAAYTGLTTGTYYPAISADTTTTRINFGQRPFSHTPPIGYKALNSFNVAEVTGDVESPDFVWIKSRSAALDHALFNTVIGAGKYLKSNGTATAEVTDVNSLIQFNKNGFLLGNSSIVNTSAATYVANAWKAGASTVTNTDGTITSQVRANPISGLSIVNYVGIGSSPKTVGHGLGVAPKLILHKERNNAFNWRVWHTALGATQIFEGLNTPNPATTQTTFNSVLPTPSVISVGNADSNTIGNNYLMYVFAEIDGFSKFGSYLSNNDTNGPFVYTGFRPRWIIIKQKDVSRGWIMYDTARNQFNVTDSYFFADTNAIANTAALLDITSNGFRLRTNNVNTNTTANSIYTYIAFAENPFKYALAR